MSTDQTDSLNIDNDIKNLYESINKTITLAIRHNSEITNLEDLKKYLKRMINFQDIMHKK
ncbi:MAG: hypothetical protein ACR5KW_03850 [Wolbachia sp.]